MSCAERALCAAAFGDVGGVADTVTAHQRDRIGIPTSVIRHEGRGTLDLCEAIILYYTRGVKGREVLTRTRRQGREEAVSSACVRGLCGGVDGPSRTLEVGCRRLWMRAHFFGGR